MKHIKRAFSSEIARFLKIKLVVKMNRKELKEYIQNNYGAHPDYPWMKFPSYEVFRHKNNKKWFAVIMDVPRIKLGLQGTETIEIVNFKCGPVLTGSLLDKAGFLPAYHMNKTNWITVLLDGSVLDDTVKTLLDISFEATALKVINR